MVLKGQRPDPTSVYKLHPDFRCSREVPNFVVADFMTKAHPAGEASTLKRPKVRINFEERIQHLPLCLH